MLPHPYHMPATPTPCRTGPLAFAIEGRSLGACGRPPGSQRFEAGANSDAFAENLAGDRGSFIVQRVHDSEFEAVDSQPISEIVVKLFLRDSRLRHAKTAEGSRRHQMRMHCSGERAIVRK